jgi:hypothetical protein
MRGVGSTIILFTLGVLTAPGHLEADQRTARITAAQRALDAWYTCIECQDGELDKLLRYRDLVEETLIHTLQNGPSPARRAEIEAGLRSSHQSSPSQTISEDRYVELFMSNADAKFRTRAAMALGRVRSQDALQALREAERNEKLRPDVRLAAKEARTGRSVR